MMWALVQQGGHLGSQEVLQAHVGTLEAEAAECQAHQEEDGQGHRDHDDLGHPLDALDDDEVDADPCHQQPDRHTQRQAAQVARTRGEADHRVVEVPLGVVTPRQAHGRAGVEEGPGDDDGVVGHHDEPEQEHHPADPTHAFVHLHEGEGSRDAHRLAHAHLQYQQRDAGDEHGEDVRYEERTAVVLVREVREPPHVAEAYR